MATHGRGWPSQPGRPTINKGRIAMNPRDDALASPSSPTHLSPPPTLLFPLLSRSPFRPPSLPSFLALPFTLALPSTRPHASPR
eukprot:1613089-Rhodomonas_salina.1